MFLNYSPCRSLVEVGPWTLKFTKDMNYQMVESGFRVNSEICSLRVPHLIKYSHIWISLSLFGNYEM